MATTAANSKLFRKTGKPVRFQLWPRTGIFRIIFMNAIKKRKIILVKGMNRLKKLNAESAPGGKDKLLYNLEVTLKVLME